MSKLRDILKTETSAALAKHEYVNRDGLSAFWTAIKDKFAPATHNHTAADINSGTLPITRGGTGKTTVLSASKALGRGFGTCLTPAATAAKVVALTDFTRLIGAMAAVRFTYANTADNPTLNVNNTGASAIYNCYTNAAIVSGNITAGMTGLFVFNGNQWVLMNPAATQSSKV